MNFSNLKTTALINAYCAVKIPLLAFCLPKVVEMSDSRSEVKVALSYRTRNHLGVMYFGGLAMGAELSVALKCVTTIPKTGKKIDFLFKDFSAEFLKRADGDVHFICDEAGEVEALVRQASETDERLNKTFNGYAIVPSKGVEPVMKYTLTLSVKQRRKKS
jgi:hypothetical protein